MSSTKSWISNAESFTNESISALRKEPWENVPVVVSDEGLYHAADEVHPYTLMIISVIVPSTAKRQWWKFPKEKYATERLSATHAWMPERSTEERQAAGICLFVSACDFSVPFDIKLSN